MKKTSLFAAALLAAALFVGCSDGSDSAVGYYSAALPASVGTNDFAGKTFVQTIQNFGTYKYKFDATSITYEGETINTETTLSSAYTKKEVRTYSYSYNSTTRALYMLSSGISTNYLVRGGVTTILPKIGYFATDAQFIAAWKICNKPIYDKASDEQLTEQAKKARVSYFNAYGYTVMTGASEVSNEIIAKYNADQAVLKKNLVDIYDYQMTNTGAKWLLGSRVPAGIGLNDIYGTYNLPLQIKNGDTISYYLSYSNSSPAIQAAPNKMSGFKVSAITPTAVLITDSATKNSTTYEWSYTSSPVTRNYTTSKTDTTGTFVIDNLGTITVTYATANNIPDISYAPEYTKQ